MSTKEQLEEENERLTALLKENNIDPDSLTIKGRYIACFEFDVNSPDGDGDVGIDHHELCDIQDTPLYGLFIDGYVRLKDFKSLIDDGYIQPVTKE